MHLLCTSHTLTCTHTNGELQNRHGNHKAQMEKRRGESHISVFNSHLAMKQQNDVLQEINSHRTHIHPNATMDTFFPCFLFLTDVAINLTVSFWLCWSFWRASGAYLTFIRTSVAMDNPSHQCNNQPSLLEILYKTLLEVESDSASLVPLLVDGFFLLFFFFFKLTNTAY